MNIKKKGSEDNKYSEANPRWPKVEPGGIMFGIGIFSNSKTCINPIKLKKVEIITTEREIVLNTESSPRIENIIAVKRAMQYSIRRLLNCNIKPDWEPLKNAVKNVNGKINSSNNNFLSKKRMLWESDLCIINI